MTTKMSRTERAIVERLVKSMGFETTEERRSDSLDFRDVSVLSAVDAVLEAFREGARIGHEMGVEQGRLEAKREAMDAVTSTAGTQPGCEVATALAAIGGVR